MDEYLLEEYLLKLKDLNDIVKERIDNNCEGIKLLQEMTSKQQKIITELIRMVEILDRRTDK